jgi:hypothetical protein
MSTQTDFWYNNPTILFDREKLIEFFPSGDLNLNRKLNAIQRLSIYISVALCIYTNDSRYITVCIIAGLVTYMIYTSTNAKETLQNTNITPLSNDLGVINELKTIDLQGNAITDPFNTCTKPVEGNPFMNFTNGDYLNLTEDGKIVDKPKNCPINNTDIINSQNKIFNENLFRDVNDLMGKNNSDRQFYTMPNTELVNRQDEFAKWCYLTPMKTCKEDTGNCNPYTDIRANKQVWYDENTNPENSGARSN